MTSAGSPWDSSRRPWASSWPTGCCPGSMSAGGSGPSSRPCSIAVLERLAAPGPGGARDPARLGRRAAAGGLRAGVHHLAGRCGTSPASGGPPFLVGVPRRLDRRGRSRPRSSGWSRRARTTPSPPACCARRAARGGQTSRTPTCRAWCSSRPTACPSRCSSWGVQRRHAADAVPLGPQRVAPHGRVAAPAAGHHPGQPDGHPARHHRRASPPSAGWSATPAGCWWPTSRPTRPIIEAMHSDGRGLLVDDGVSVSNLFTGDAPTAYVTMSAIKRTQETRQARRVGLPVPRPARRAWPAACRGRSARSSASGSRQRGPSAPGRPPAGRTAAGRFAVERAALNGVLRDLNTSLVAESMLAGRRSIYVDYVDYDAVAHHAGMLRPESMDALDGDRRGARDSSRRSPRSRRGPTASWCSPTTGSRRARSSRDRYGEDLATLVAPAGRRPVTAAIDAELRGRRAA